MACLFTSQTIPPVPTSKPAAAIATVIQPTAESISEISATKPPIIPSPIPKVVTFPNPDNYFWETIITGLDRPVELRNANDGTGRLFVLEKEGRIQIIKDGFLFPEPFLDIVSLVGSSSNEQGLLGLAFHPSYVGNGYFYLYYTNNQGHAQIDRFTVTVDPDVADDGSRLPMLTINQPFPNHNGGALAFGPDGYLYIGVGDGGSAADPFNNGQDLDTLLGKLLRLDVDSAEPYAIPPDNPFGNQIWAYGMRNPWRISFDTFTGDLFIGDVGQGEWEEIDFLPAGSPGGLNFGWKYFEGAHPFSGTPPEGLQLVDPVAEYDHSQGCSVTGGYVYRGSMPEWNGIYFYGDYCTRTVWGLIHSEAGWQNLILFGAGGNITSFGQDEFGEIFIATYGGQILRLSPR
ncbi:MAG: PQQ-dependent sugar dehydrogenase [Anaerolineae bacterium]|nr:PQQ-dependent sugar dehydrogenase [Anaerolineae bacterium]MDK1118090.1 PQQ-dependent sugar dehydrogenase [Anaerolineae bacterium]